MLSVFSPSLTDVASLKIHIERRLQSVIWMDISDQSEFRGGRNNPCPQETQEKKSSVQTENDYIALKKDDPKLCCVRAEP